ncbi:hypothetical protein E2562_012256 [Oryza meyeriana var. granulata]|uniref:Uncharacterized protein n=1 Tax=Oryza meyeriana var. granulata TaxID=110450 RepID=A0A6G1D2X5_9ORYZ|nr:hypothetical protein E2562_012256 [Oryza meyeriana var. granulata]
MPSSGGEGRVPWRRIEAVPAGGSSGRSGRAGHPPRTELVPAERSVRDRIGGAAPSRREGGQPRYAARL